MKASYALMDFVQERNQKIPADSFIPLFSIIWHKVDDAFRENLFSGVKLATFNKKGGHYDRGLWECTVDDELVSVTPIYTDIDIITDGSIYMVWRIEIQADKQEAVDRMFSKLGLFFKKYAKDDREFKTLYEQGVEVMEQYNPSVLSSDLRRFYNLGGSGGQ